MTRVRFLAGWRVWNSGEIAGFPDAEAEALVRAGVAELADVPEALAEVPSAAEDEEAAPPAEAADLRRSARGADEKADAP